MALTNPEIINNQSEFGKFSKEYRSLEKIVIPYERYVKVLAEHKFAKESLNGDDADMRELAKMEMPGLDEEKDNLEKELTKLLIPKDPQDDKNAIIEIRAGTGGDEAALFAGDLYRMYMRFCERKGWKIQVMDVTEGSAGGYKEVVLEITGEDAYGQLKYESGVHRVQRARRLVQLHQGPLVLGVEGEVRVVFLGDDRPRVGVGAANLRSVTLMPPVVACCRYTVPNLLFEPVPRCACRVSV